MLGKDIAERILNNPKVRAALSQQVPWIGRLESLDSLKDLRLVNTHLIPGGDGTIVSYTATAATNELYQDPVQALKDDGVIPRGAKEPERIDTATHNEGRPDESKRVEFINYVRSFGLCIDIRNPDYRG